MPIQISQGNCQYTSISTAGTTTVSPGRADGNPPAQAPGAFYGFSVLSLGTGTSYTVNVYDIITQVTGTGTVTTTNTLVSGTATAVGGVFTPGPAALGVRYRGSLVVVTGTGVGNALWD